MPAMANLTVKKHDGTTDVVYNTQQPAAGDGAWAKWRQDTGNSNPYSARPTLAVRTLESKGGIRRVEILYVYPYFWTDTTTGQIVVSPLNVSNRNGVWTVPQGIPVGFIVEATAQFVNLLGHSDMRTCLRDQSSFT